MLKIRPNDPCPCGSGRKHKKCCGAEPEGRGRFSLLSQKRGRYAKSPEEIAGMRRSGRFNAELMEYLRPLIRPGLSTEDINGIVHEYTLRHGHIPAPLNYRGFPKSVCTSLNDVVCHGIPSATEVIKDGDILNVDITSIVAGFHGDMNETFYIGTNISATARLVTETAREALKIGLRAVKPGRTLYDVAAAIQDYVEARGCSVVREFTGHGIGRGFHEDPQVPHYRTPESRKVLLEPGMTFTIEPMVNAGHWRTRVLADGWTAVTEDGSLSAQFEHTVLVTEAGVEVLTALPGSPPF